MPYFVHFWPRSFKKRSPLLPSSYQKNKKFIHIIFKSLSKLLCLHAKKSELLHTLISHKTWKHLLWLLSHFTHFLAKKPEEKICFFQKNHIYCNFKPSGYCSVIPKKEHLISHITLSTSKNNVFDPFNLKTLK